MGENQSTSQPDRQSKGASAVQPKNKQDMRARLNGVLLLLPLLGFLWLGGPLLSLVLTALCVIMAFEVSKMTLKSAPIWQLSVLSVWVALPVFLAFSGISPMLLLGFLLLSFCLLSWRFTLFAGMYTILLGLCFFALIALQTQPDAQLILIYLIALTSAVDVGAYFAGRALGGPKLAPAISPGKTISGALGGIVAGLCAYLVLDGVQAISLGWPIGFVLALTLLAQLGDLLESALKRQTGVKDSGQIIPGHGGLLDRFDGYVLTLPLVWFWLYQS